MTSEKSLLPNGSLGILKQTSSICLFIASKSQYAHIIINYFNFTLMLNDVLCYFVNFQCTIYNTAIVAQLVERWFRDPGSRVVFTVGGLGVSFFPPGPGCVFKCISFGQSSSPYFKSIYLQYVGNWSVVKVYLIRPKPGPVARDAAPRPSSWESN